MADMTSTNSADLQGLTRETAIEIDDCPSPIIDASSPPAPGPLTVPRVVKIGQKLLEQVKTTEVIRKGDTIWAGILHTPYKDCKELVSSACFQWAKCNPTKTLKTLRAKYFEKNPLSNLKLAIPEKDVTGELVWDICQDNITIAGIKDQMANIGLENGAVILRAYEHVDLEETEDESEVEVPTSKDVNEEETGPEYPAKAEPSSDTEDMFKNFKAFDGEGNAPSNAIEVSDGDDDAATEDGENEMSSPEIVHAGKEHNALYEGPTEPNMPWLTSTFPPASVIAGEKYEKPEKANRKRKVVESSEDEPPTKRAKVEIKKETVEPDTGVAAGVAAEKIEVKKNASKRQREEEEDDEDKAEAPAKRVKVEAGAHLATPPPTSSSQAEAVDASSPASCLEAQTKAAKEAAKHGVLDPVVRSEKGGPKAKADIKKGLKFRIKKKPAKKTQEKVEEKIAEEIRAEKAASAVGSKKKAANPEKEVEIEHGYDDEEVKDDDETGYEAATEYYPEDYGDDYDEEPPHLLPVKHGGEKEMGEQEMADFYSAWADEL